MKVVCFSFWNVLLSSVSHLGCLNQGRAVNFLSKAFSIAATKLETSRQGKVHFSSIKIDVSVLN